MAKRGRPALSEGDTQIIMVRFPAWLVKELDAVAGAGRRAEFIRGAVEAALGMAAPAASD